MIRRKRAKIEAAKTKKASGEGDKYERKLARPDLPRNWPRECNTMHLFYSTKTLVVAERNGRMRTKSVDTFLEPRLCAPYI